MDGEKEGIVSKALKLASALANEAKKGNSGCSSNKVQQERIEFKLEWGSGECMKTLTGSNKNFSLYSFSLSSHHREWTFTFTHCTCGCTFSCGDGGCCNLLWFWSKDLSGLWQMRKTRNCALTAHLERAGDRLVIPGTRQKYTTFRSNQFGEKMFWPF